MPCLAWTRIDVRAHPPAWYASEFLNAQHVLYGNLRPLIYGLALDPEIIGEVGTAASKPHGVADDLGSQGCDHPSSIYCGRSPVKVQFTK